jgi:hypothetical protein
MAEVAIRRAPGEVLKLAQDVIDECHEHLLEAVIMWLFTTSKRTRGGHVVLGTSSRTNPLQRYLSSIGMVSSVPADYIVLLDEKRWQRALATQRVALLDHLCCTMIQKETVNKRSGEITKSWATVGPDVTEFSGVIRRRGIWLPEQQVFARAVRETGRTIEIKFPDLDGDPDETPSTNGKPPDRTTTVDDQGTVVATERVADASPGDADGGHATAAVEDEAGSESGSLTASESPLSANGHIDVPMHDASWQGEPVGPGQRTDDMPMGDVRNEDNWQEQAGIGTSELAIHRARRRRGTVSSEQGEASS